MKNMLRRTLLTSVLTCCVLTMNAQASSSGPFIGGAAGGAWSSSPLNLDGVSTLVPSAYWQGEIGYLWRNLPLINYGAEFLYGNLNRTDSQTSNGVTWNTQTQIQAYSLLGIVQLQFIPLLNLHVKAGATLMNQYFTTDLAGADSQNIRKNFVAPTAGIGMTFQFLGFGINFDLLGSSAPDGNASPLVAATVGLSYNF